MKALSLITQYQQNHTGMSNYIDNRLGEVQQALQDADYRAKEGEADWQKVNMYIAQKIIESILQAIPYTTPVRGIFADIYRAINDEI